MISNIIEEENLSKRAYHMGFIKKFIFFQLPFLLLLAYSFLLRSYISIGYFFLALILVNMEFEKRYTVSKDIQKFSGDKHARLTDLFKFRNYTLGVYYLLLIFSLAVFVLKFLVLFLYYSSYSTYQKIIDKIDPENFELYFIEEVGIKNVLLTILPNFGAIMVSAVILLFRAYLRNLKLNSMGKFRGLFVSKYIFITICALLVSAFAIIEISGISLLFVAVISLYFLFWGNASNNRGNFFYFFSKLLQILSILTLITQYVLSIGTIEDSFKGNVTWNFDFIGVVSLTKLTYKVRIYLLTKRIIFSFRMYFIC